ncbi:MAG: tetratricopeptide repeat protein [Nitrospirae bacterium]|nr:tetratricopeptide repeat protein [Nitrospirota bacterium]
MTLNKSALAVVFIMFISLVFAQPFLSNVHAYTEKEFEIAVTKGGYLIDNANYDEAVTHLKLAREMKPSDPEAALLLGIAYSRSGRFAAAKPALMDALRSEPDNPRINYELGLVMMQAGEIDEARDQFTEVVGSKADENTKAAARKYLETLKSAAGQGGKALRLGVALGGQYDSNVILEPDNPVSPSSGKKADWRAIVSANAGVTLFDTGRFAADVDYNFYQSKHKDVTNFDVQQHSVSLSGRYSPARDMRTELGYALAYATVGGDEYSVTHTFRPSIAVAHTSGAITEFYFAQEFRNFINGADFETNSDRTGTNAAFGMAQTRKLGENSGWGFGYKYERESADKETWDYNGHTGNLNFSAGTGTIRVMLGATLAYKEYLRESDSDSIRRDTTQDYSADMVWSPTESVSLTLSEVYTINNSNIGKFDYKRSITGLFLGVKL